MVLNSITRFLRFPERQLGHERKIRHVAVVLQAGQEDALYVVSHKTTFDEIYRRRNKILQGLVEAMVKRDIPICTVYLLSSEEPSHDNFSLLMDSFAQLFSELKENQMFHTNQVKVTVLGRWYDLPGRVVEPIKAVVDATKDYDRFFFNLCMNYSGREEIVNACKLIAMQVQSDRLDLNAIDQAMVKDNLYSSYFIPPDVVIKNGSSIVTDLLLWDLPGTRIVFTGKSWPDFGKADFLDALHSR